MYYIERKNIADIQYRLESIEAFDFRVTDIEEDDDTDELLFFVDAKVYKKDTDFVDLVREIDNALEGEYTILDYSFSKYVDEVFLCLE